jgi:drug/metabolite transporter (DMT)-like permease
MFIKVAVRDLDPSTLILGRLGLASLTLLAVVPWLVGGGTAWADFRTHWRWLVVVGLLNTAIPFWLLSWGETRIDSGLASIIQASVPIFNALLAFGYFHDERVTGGRLLGVGVGFVGVAVLVGAQPHAKLLGALAVVGMALC